MWRTVGDKRNAREVKGKRREFYTGIRLSTAAMCSISRYLGWHLTVREAVFRELTVSGQLSESTNFKVIF